MENAAVTRNFPLEAISSKAYNFMPRNRLIRIMLSVKPFSWYQVYPSEWFNPTELIRLKPILIKA